MKNYLNDIRAQIPRIPIQTMDLSSWEILDEKQFSLDHLRY